MGPTSAKTGQIWGTRHPLEIEISQPSLTQGVRENPDFCWVLSGPTEEAAEKGRIESEDRTLSG